MNLEPLRKAIVDLGVLERMKGVDAVETVLFRENLAKAVKEMTRRGLFRFGLNLQTPPEPQLPATAPQHNLPPTKEEFTRPSESHTLLDQLTARPPSGPTELNRREFTQRTASLAARAAMPSMGGSSVPTEDPKTTAAKKLVADFVGTGDYETHPDLGYERGRKLIEAFKIHPDYEHSLGGGALERIQGHAANIFTHKGGEHQVNLMAVPERETTDLRGLKRKAPSFGSGQVNPYIHNVEDHPDYDSALTEKAHDVWNRHNQGEQIYMSGHDRSSALVSGPHLAQYEGDGTDINGDPISHHKLYEHDWNNTGEITPVESPAEVKDALHSQMRGGKTRKGEDIRKWMNDEVNYTA